MKRKSVTGLVVIGLALTLAALLAACGGSTTTSSTAPGDRAASPAT